MTPKQWFSSLGRQLGGKKDKNKNGEEGQQDAQQQQQHQQQAAAAAAPAEPPEPLSETVVANLIMAMSYVSANFKTEEGLYRVPGSKEAVDTLTKSMLQHPISPSVLDGYEANDICDAVKAAMHACEPVFPHGCYDELLACQSAPADLPRIKAIIAQRMPAANFRLFCHLVLHFRELVDQNSVADATSYSRASDTLPHWLWPPPRVCLRASLHVCIRERAGERRRLFKKGLARSQPPVSVLRLILL